MAGPGHVTGVESARKDRRTPKASPVWSRVRASRQRHGVRQSFLPLLNRWAWTCQWGRKRQKRQAHSKSFASMEPCANLAPASWSAAVFSAAFELLGLDMSVGSKAPEKTGALQKLRQYGAVCEPRASVMECGSLFCRF